MEKVKRRILVKESSVNISDTNQKLNPTQNRTLTLKLKKKTDSQPIKN